MSICLIFLDEGEEKPINVNPSDQMGTVFTKYLKSIGSPTDNLTTQVYSFFKGKKLLNKSNDYLLRTVDEVGLNTDNIIRVDRKFDRNYALNKN